MRAARGGQAAPRHQAVERAGDARRARRPPRLRRGHGARPRAREAAAKDSEIVGTAATWRPSRRAGEPPTPRRDWYSVGAMLYEALVGRPPFVGAALDVAHDEEHVDPRPPRQLRRGCAAGPRRAVHARSCAAKPASGRPGARDPPPSRAAGRAAAPPAARRRRTGRHRASSGASSSSRALREAFEATLASATVTVRVARRVGHGQVGARATTSSTGSERGEAVVLRGRAYERESVPYKAVDSVIDALSRHLLAVIEDEDRRSRCRRTIGRSRASSPCSGASRRSPAHVRARSARRPAARAAPRVRRLRELFGRARAAAAARHLHRRRAVGRRRQRGAPSRAVARAGAPRRSCS